MESFSELKTELVRQGRNYASEAVNYRAKIAELALGFIKDDSVVSSIDVVHFLIYLIPHSDTHTFLFSSSHANSFTCT